MMPMQRILITKKSYTKYPVAANYICNNFELERRKLEIIQLSASCTDQCKIYIILCRRHSDG